MIVAYLRVSTQRQHISNQQKEIKRYAAARGLVVDQWCSDVVSGKVPSAQRLLGEIVAGLHEGDHLIVTEVSRLSRRLVDIMTIIQECVQRKVVLHSIKEGYIFEDNINSKILGFAFGLVAEIERNLISARTREALAARKAAGKRLGRPQGSSPRTEILRRNHEAIVEMLGRRVPQREIAAAFNVSECTLRRYLKSTAAAGKTASA